MTEREEFEKWWKENLKFLGEEDDFNSWDAWQHQQKKIDELKADNLSYVTQASKDATEIVSLQAQLNVAVECLKYIKALGGRKAEIEEQQKPLSNEVLNFLHGTGALEGCYFGETPKSAKGKFWWRKYLPLPDVPTE